MLIINVDKGNIEKALKQYKRKTIKTKQMKKVRDEKEYTKPSALKRLKFQKAIYLQKKSDAENKDKQKYNNIFFYFILPQTLPELNI